MAVAMETAGWREVQKKRAAWGADAQQLMQMMMGQLQSEPANVSELSTLDLLGKPDPCLDLDFLPSRDFLHLDPEEPLPSGWEKCLDLKTGKVYYVNKSSGVSTFIDPRKQTEVQAHEFLGSKRSEENSVSSSSGSPLPKQSTSSQLLSFSTGKQLWNLQLDDRHEDDSNLELDLNLAAGGSSSPSQQTVCTMEMIQNALKRTTTIPKREIPHKLSVSSSFSSLTSTRSDPVDSSVAPSPSTSSSSSTSSRSRKAAAPLHEPRACEGDSKGECGALVMGACTRCLMYVMLKKVDPRCPRCESEVPVDFSSPPCKRPRVLSERR